MTDSTINAAASPQRATQDHRHYLRPHYQPGIPAAIEVPDAPLSELLETAARFYPDRVAIDFLGATMTYQELLEASERAAQVLRTSGVHKGDRVALIMPNCPQHAVALYGALRIGAIVAEHNPLAPAEEIRSQLDAHGAQVVIVWEKGIDLITRIIDEMLEHENMQFVLLGTGEHDYEEWFKELAWRHPTKASVNIRFSNQLAQRIYAGSNIFLMPSTFEPCGLGQLIAMRYGSIPVVRETGGLKDTVVQFDRSDPDKGNGFLFYEYNAHEMMYAVKRALAVYENLREWRQLVYTAMKSDYSWTRSAGEYKQLYERLQKKK